MADQQRRRCLAEFLRSRRERLTPEEAGILAGPRRRTPGLRREEVAQLSGVSVTWYTWLEQARDITVSRQVLTSLARALMLSSIERRHLFALAGVPLPEQPPGRGPGPALQRLVDALEPHPAYLLDANWDLVGWNRAEAGLIGDPGQLEPAERNLLWLVFMDPAMRTLMVDWEGQAQNLVAQFRADARARFGDPRFERLTGGLREASAEFRGWWEAHDIADFGSNRRQFRHPWVGRLTFDYVKLAAMDAPGVKLFACMPADAETSGKLPALQRCATGEVPDAAEVADAVDELSVSRAGA
ncbi:helix-turn-helix transcriptional regulator [Streptomyces lydicus]|uniref:helix-turn-helix transcriptional regulator n=1 Tax=Streptomyces lydicus TaxID=47763 RepID=UPI00068A0B7C|nr:helix-turn-helix transcriptional regulator [Streptomyces lydicus]MDC7337791.1 helix-turn-helix transcriptional regulator [Streptomyces lydicus]UEG92808.1 helix-turn-helix transcriptional regulator [Streptomyces lydicus]